MVLMDIKKKLFGAKGDMLLDISLNIKNGEFLVLAGESGSGKTTLLRVLAGLESAKGKIVVDGEVWLDDEVSLAPQKREIGFVFQDYGLFPNMSVEQNLLFVKKDVKLAKYLLNITELYSLKGRYPNSLSGGQKQRVAICRALMRRPKLLLMDEPLSALDPKMRQKLQKQILKLHREFNTTTIMVSHDLAEIYTLADRVAIIESGRVANIGTPKEVFLTKKSSTLEFRGEIISIEEESLIVSIGKDIVKVALDKNKDSFKVGDEITLFVDSSTLKIR